MLTRARSDRLASLLAFAVPLVVFAASSYRDVGYWDAGEMDTVPWILGIAHPTGFPAYVVIGWLWSHALPFGSVAFRMSLLSACAMSLAAWSVGRIVRDAWPADAWLGTACAWFFAFGPVAWTRGTRAEVHAVAIAALTLTMLFTLRWYRAGRPANLLAAAVACGAGIAVHPIVASAIPAGIVLLAGRRGTGAYRAFGIAALAGALSAGIWFAYLPLRSAYVTAHGVDPTSALGVAPGSAFWDYDHPAALQGFIALVSGAEFDVENGAAASLTTPAALQSAPSFFATLVRELTWPGLLIAMAGAIVAWRGDPFRCAYLAICGGIVLPFALSFKAESDVERYFLPAFACATIFAGDLLGQAGENVPRAREAAAIPFLMAAWLVFQGQSLFAQPRDARARVTIDDVQSLTPPNAIVIADWPYATPLAYAAYVEGLMGARIVDPGSLAGNARALASWAKTRSIYVIGGQIGPVPGFALERVSAREPLYRVVPAK